MSTVDQVDPLPILRALVKERYGTQTEAARRWGVQDMLVSRVLRGMREPPDWMLAEAGLKRAIVVCRV